MDWVIEEAYGREPADRLHGCQACNVTWFGAENRCWVCDGTIEGPVEAVPPNGSETWSAARCADSAEAEETSAFLRRVVPA